jgi:hypothetical protein
MRIAVLDDYHRSAGEFADWDSLGAGTDQVDRGVVGSGSDLSATLAERRPACESAPAPG